MRRAIVILPDQGSGVGIFRGALECNENILVMCAQEFFNEEKTLIRKRRRFNAGICHKALYSIFSGEVTLEISNVVNAWTEAMTNIGKNVRNEITAIALSSDADQI